MALLVGRDDIGNFGGNGFFGFGVLATANSTGAAVTAAGTATSLETNITGFGGQAHIRASVYERVGAAGTASLLQTVDILSAAAPQSTALSNLTITSGNEYFVTFAQPSSDGGTFWNSSIDNTAADFTVDSGLVGDYTTPLSSLTIPLTTDVANNEIYWYLDGTVGGGTAVTGPATATDGSATTITGTGLTGAASVSIGLSGSELAQTFGTVTDTTIAIAAVESGWDDAVVGTPATAFPLEPTILAGGTTPYQLQIVVDAITPFSTTINPASGFQVLQTTIAAANTTVGESIFGSNIITVEDDMQARYPSVVSGVTVTIDSAGVPNLNGTELAAAGGSITFNTAYYSPLNGQVSVVTLTLTDGSVSVADPELSASDTMAQALRGLGFTGTLQDMQLQWLSSMGYTTGSLSDRWREMLDFEAIVDDGLNTRKLKFYESELLTSGKSFLETQKDYWASRI